MERVSLQASHLRFPDTVVRHWSLECHDIEAGGTQGSFKRGDLPSGPIPCLYIYHFDLFQIPSFENCTRIYLRIRHSVRNPLPPCIKFTKDKNYGIIP